MNVLGTITPEQFFSEYWQKKPLLIRNAIPGFSCPFSADDLAGLACEEQVEARIVIESLKGKPWQVKNGPFTAKDFKKLPNGPWTLLVQGVDHWVSELAPLLDQFRFIPNWRLDDIMASYAPPGGSVGPHFDYYDVFLLQASGQRNWKIGQHCNETSARLNDTPLRILQEFHTTEEWTLNPGDMLYLPPQIAHFGIAESDCITLSIGFRSPTESEILSHYTDHILESIQTEIHLDDPDLKLQDNPGEIASSVITKLRKVLLDKLDNPVQLTQWFGEFITAPKNADTLILEENSTDVTELFKALTAGAQLLWNEGSRFAYYQHIDHEFLLFCDGRTFTRPADYEQLLKLICQKSHIDTDKLLQETLNAPEKMELIAELINQGSLYFSDL